MRNFFIKPVKFYQHYISAFLPSSCRYYPSCSEYCIWQFKNSSILRAFFATAFRILRCNQFFKGGIDYPICKKRFAPFTIFSQHNVIKPEFWFIPCKKNGYYTIKSVDFKKEKMC